MSSHCCMSLPVLSCFILEVSVLMYVGRILFSLDIPANNCALCRIFGCTAHNMLKEFLHSGDTYEASLVHRPCMPCVALSPLSHSSGRAGGLRTSLCVSLIDHRHLAGKVVRVSRENDRPLHAPRGIRHHHPPQGRTCLPRNEPIWRIVKNVLKLWRRHGPARSMVKVRPLQVLSHMSHASASAYDWKLQTC